MGKKYLSLMDTSTRRRSVLQQQPANIHTHKHERDDGNTNTTRIKSTLSCSPTHTPPPSFYRMMIVHMKTADAPPSDKIIYYSLLFFLSPIEFSIR